MAKFFKSRVIHLSEIDIRYAMEHTQSNRAAALFLKVAFATYKNYATRYYDPVAGKTLYDLHKNQAGKKITRKSMKYVKIKDLIEGGMHKNYSDVKFKIRLVEEGILIDKCNRCGFYEIRTADLVPPTMLVYRDGNPQNKNVDNLEICCYNCVFLYYQNYSVSFKIQKDKDGK